MQSAKRLRFFFEDTAMKRFDYVLAKQYMGWRTRIPMMRLWMPLPLDHVLAGKVGAAVVAVYMIDPEALPDTFWDEKCYAWLMDKYVESGDREYIRGLGFGNDVPSSLPSNLFGRLRNVEEVFGFSERGVFGDGSLYLPELFEFSRLEVRRMVYGYDFDIDVSKFGHKIERIRKGDGLFYLDYRYIPLVEPVKSFGGEYFSEYVLSRSQVATVATASTWCSVEQLDERDESLKRIRERECLRISQFVKHLKCRYFRDMIRGMSKKTRDFVVRGDESLVDEVCGRSNWTSIRPFEAGMMEHYKAPVGINPPHSNAKPMEPVSLGPSVVLGRLGVWGGLEVADLEDPFDGGCERMYAWNGVRDLLVNPRVLKVNN